MSDSTSDLLEKIIGWLIPIMVAIGIYSFKDRIARATVETSLKGEGQVTNTMVINAIHEIEKMQGKMDDILEDVHNLDKKIAVMKSQLNDVKARLNMPTTSDDVT